MLRPLCKRLVGCYKLSSSSCRFLFSFMFFTTFVLLWQTETLGWEITFQYGRAEIFKRGLSSIVVVMLWPGSKTSEYRVLCTIIVLYDCKYHTLREKCLYLEFFLVRIFLYGEILSPFTVRMRGNTDQKNFKYRYFWGSDIFKGTIAEEEKPNATYLLYGLNYLYKSYYHHITGK